MASGDTYYVILISFNNKSKLSYIQITNLIKRKRKKLVRKRACTFSRTLLEEKKYKHTNKLFEKGG